MARLEDHDILEKFRQALSDWAGVGIRWERNSPGREWVYENLECGLEGVNRLMHYRLKLDKEFFIRQQVEDRKRWRDLWAYHYDFIFKIEGKMCYIETRLVEDSRIDPPYVQVVNMHEAR